MFQCAWKALFFFCLKTGHVFSWSAITCMWCAVLWICLICCKELGGNNFVLCHFSPDHPSFVKSSVKSFLHVCRFQYFLLHQNMIAIKKCMSLLPKDTGVVLERVIVSKIGASLHVCSFVLQICPQNSVLVIFHVLYSLLNFSLFSLFEEQKTAEIRFHQIMWIFWPQC